MASVEAHLLVGSLVITSTGSADEGEQGSSSSRSLYEGWCRDRSEPAEPIVNHLFWYRGLSPSMETRKQ